MGKFWIPVVAALFVIITVLYESALLAFLRQGRRAGVQQTVSGTGPRIRLLPCVVILGAAVAAAAVAKDIMAAFAVVSVTAVLDLVVSGGQGMLGLVRGVLRRNLPPEGHA